MYSTLATFWRKMGGYLQWRILWIFHSKFILGTSAVVFDNDGRILLLRHRFWKSGSWGLPSGYAISGETIEQTVQRELKEETGYEVHVERLLRIKSGFKLRLEITFVARLTGGTQLLDPKEIIEAEFFNLNNLPDGLIPSHKELILQSISPVSNLHKANGLVI